MADRINETYHLPKQGGIVTNVAAEKWDVTISALDVPGVNPDGTPDESPVSLILHRMPVGTLYWQTTELVVGEDVGAGITVDVGIRQYRSHGLEPLYEDLKHFAEAIPIGAEGAQRLFSVPKEVRVPEDDPDAISVRGLAVEHDVIVTLNGDVAGAIGAKFSLIPMFWVTAAYD